MKNRFANPAWITLVAVLAIAFVLVGSSLIAATKSTPAGTTCAMKDGCPMMAKGCCGMIDAKVIAVNSDGSITVKVAPAAGAPDSMKQAFAKAKVGDSFPAGVCGDCRADGGCKACCGDDCKACCGDNCANCKGCAEKTSMPGCSMGKCPK